MFDENLKWFGQSLLTYKDKQYGSDGYLRAAISTNSNDYKNFNSPTFNITISNSYQKTYTLDYVNSNDLLKAFEEALSKLNGDNIDIQRVNSKGFTLHFTVIPQDEIVAIQIISNETDFTKIVIPLRGVFEAFARSLRYYVENYFKICSDLFLKTIDSNLYITAEQLPGLIKGISSQIVGNYNPGNEGSDRKEVEKTAQTIDDLDNFLGQDMENIKVPEIENGKIDEKAVTEINSKFVEKVIENDLYNLEMMLNNAALSNQSFITISNEIKTRLDIKRDQFTMIPGIPADEMKSLAYMTRLFYLLTLHNNMDKNIPIPSGIPVFKYMKDAAPDVVDVALDLFLFGGYIRILRRRLEDKIENSIQNKSMLYLQYRCFLDPLIFSFIEHVPSETLESIIVSRYKYYDEKLKVFSRYTTLLSDSGCSNIKATDIASYVREVQEKVIGNTPYISDLHASFDVAKIPAKNQFSLEQIVNEVIPLELAEKQGKDIKTQEVLDKINEKYKISDEVLAYFLKKAPKAEKVKTQKETNLERFVRSYRDDIPDTCRDNFQAFIKNLGNKNFDFLECSFALEEFGENIIKGLYNWKPKDNIKISQNYKAFFEIFEEEIMTKESILSSVKNTNGAGDWDFVGQGA